MISAGASSSDVRGAFDPSRENFFCRDCRCYVHAPKGASLRVCPTPGCSRPTGFGRFAAVARPRLEEKKKRPGF